MDFGFEIEEKNGNLMLHFKQGIPNWKRYASELIKDKVILDLKNAGELTKINGDFIVYEIYNLWKAVNKFKKIYEKTRIVSDIMLLNHGIFSNSNKGELFSTYGHAHETESGEVYFILKNSCFIILSDKKNYETFILKLKKGDYAFIHPRFLHRIISYTKDCLLITIAPEKAGHNYLIVKKKGFPFHLFYDKNKKKLEIRKNKKYKQGKYKLIKKVKKNLNPLKLLETDSEKLKEILEYPEKYKKLYFIRR